MDPQEYIFLIDLSGSMNYGSGVPAINMATKALKIFVHSLPEGSLFNIVAFGSRYKPVFDGSIPYTEQSLQQALSKLQKYPEFGSCLGGTKILEPLQWVFESKKLGNVSGSDKMTRNIYLLTDGAVANA